MPKLRSARKATSLFIILLAALPPFCPTAIAQQTPQVPPLEYPDVPQSHWAADAVSRVSSSGVVEGYPDGTFRGEQAVTRYEAMVALSRSLNWDYIIDNRPGAPRFRWKSLDEIEKERLFPPAHSPDVPRGHYAYEAAQLVQRFGIMRGDEKGLFSGDKTMARYEFVTAMRRFLAVLHSARTPVPIAPPAN